MLLRRRAILTSLVLAVPATAIVAYAVDRMRTHDMELALARIVRSQLNDQVRERCESDPQWFLTGPLEGRPKNGIFVETGPESLPPRPKVVPQPFELFAYDEAFVPSSSGSARFPPDFRRALRASGNPVTAPYETPEGTGVQFATPTGWIASPCMYFLGRMAPPPNQLRQRLHLVAGIFAVAFAVALAAMWPMALRVRRVAKDTRAAVDGGYTAIATEKRKDELSSLTFMFNDAATELHQRKARIDDQDDALRRFVVSTDQEVSRPLADLEGRLAQFALGGTVARDVLHGVLRDAHDLSAHTSNLIAVSRLRAVAPVPTEAVDLSAVVERVIARHRGVAHAAGVALEVTLVSPPVVVRADWPLLERAVANVVDNAIRYSRAGGHVTVSLVRDERERRFRLRISDDGRGVTEDEFKGLTAIRRFRGDEGRNRRPGAPGLGLSVAREVADRFSMQMELKRPAAGGFEVEFSGSEASV